MQLSATPLKTFSQGEACLGAKAICSAVAASYWSCNPGCQGGGAWFLCFRITQSNKSGIMFYTSGGATGPGKCRQTKHNLSQMVRVSSVHVAGWVDACRPLMCCNLLSWILGTVTHALQRAANRYKLKIFCSLLFFCPYLLLVSSHILLHG